MLTILLFLLAISLVFVVLAIVTRKRILAKHRGFKTAVCVFLALVFLLPAAPLTVYVTDAYALSFETQSTLGDGENWMRGLSDDLPVSEVNLPGTHDSAASRLSFVGDFLVDAAARSVLQTQHLTVAEQLSAGVRLLDLRLVEEDGAFYLYHGPAYGKDEDGKKLSLASVLADTDAFLAEHPDEFVLLMYQAEEDVDAAYRAAEAELRAGFSTSHHVLLQNGSALPTVGEARGKVYLFASSDICKWEDHYTAAPQDKIAYLETVFSAHTAQSTAAQILSSDSAGIPTPKIIYTTTYTARGTSPWYAPFVSKLPSPRAAAATVNSWLSEYGFASCESYGWILLNFATPDLCARIYLSNFESAPD